MAEFCRRWTAKTVDFCDEANAIYEGKASFPPLERPTADKPGQWQSPLQPPRPLLNVERKSGGENYRPDDYLPWRKLPTSLHFAMAKPRDQDPYATLFFLFFFLNIAQGARGLKWRLLLAWILCYSIAHRCVRSTPLPLRFRKISFPICFVEVSGTCSEMY